MERWLGLTEVAPLEPKPGVPPSSGYLAQVLQKLQATPAKFSIRAAYEDDRPSTFISEHANIPAVALPFTVGGTEQAKDLFGLYDNTISLMLRSDSRNEQIWNSASCFRRFSRACWCWPPMCRWASRC